MGYFSGHNWNVALHLRALMQRMNALPEKVRARWEGHPELTMRSHDQPADNGESEPSTFDNYQRQRERDRVSQLNLIRNAKVGSNDGSGQTIADILSKFDNFLIYRVEGARDHDSLRVFIADTSDDKEKIMIQNYNKMQSEMLELYSAIPKSKNPKAALIRMANAIAMVLGANPDDESTFDAARTICQKVAKQINTEYNSLIGAKLFYLSGCLSAAAVLSILSIICFTRKQTDFIGIGNINILVQLLYAATCASYGGFISVFKTLNQLVFEPELGNLHYMFYGLTRSLVSILGGIFIFMVINGGLALSFIADSSLLGVLVFCFVAGFSEQFVPDLLRKLEAREDGKAK